ncbi:Acylphosphatase-like domain-containing protein [Thamnocephalis sphaerospora]|uniref:acylphosphatase n=1 Tax=Thamnocephalis sphaerospora TaxID=78915 RepID=A0A4P9XKJ1_9FUNG|nr:Acylphosphatase-like domain-containing protein [Thamnocephalis sphaerospora]|eukprot:RKP06272.1 Acylphosphatase-like domain-containing protein [Thamnocephalis sphaerospora]
MTRLKQLRFEVFGVFFRQCTVDHARQLGLVGWVRNTEHDTVVGVAQGPEAGIADMRHWLREVGSPQSSIASAQFDETDIAELEHESFGVRRR